MSLSCSLTHKTHCLSPSLSLALWLTRTHTHSLSLTHSHTQPAGAPILAPRASAAGGRRDAPSFCRSKSVETLEAPCSCRDFALQITGPSTWWTSMVSLPKKRAVNLQGRPSSPPAPRPRGEDATLPPPLTHACSVLANPESCALTPSPATLNPQLVAGAPILAPRASAAGGRRDAPSSLSPPPSQGAVSGNS